MCMNIGRVKHKAFQNTDQDQAQVKHSYIMDFFKTYNHYLTLVFNKICTTNKTSRSSKLFYERKG